MTSQRKRKIWLKTLKPVCYTFSYLFQPESGGKWMQYRETKQAIQMPKFVAKSGYGLYYAAMVEKGNPATSDKISKLYEAIK